MALHPDSPQDRKQPQNKTNAAHQSGRRRPSAFLDLQRLEDRTLLAGVITGTVFLDFNGNGLFDTVSTLANLGSGTVGIRADQGLGNIVVSAYDSANTLQGTATTAADGTYTLTALGTGPYRLEFGGLPTGVFFGAQGDSTTLPPSGTAVQFVGDGNTAGVNLSVLRTQDLRTVASSNPLLTTSVYLVGAFDGASAGETAIVSFPYNAGASDSENNTSLYTNPTAHKVAVTHNQVGATWGLAYDTINNKIYAAAYTKRHSGYGPAGPGAIYRIDLPDNIPNSTDTTSPVTTASLFLDLNAATANAAAGTSFRTAAGWDYLNDGVDLGTNTFIGWNAVGKSGLGGLDVDANGQFMYTIGLADRRLYRIQIVRNADGTTSGGTITAFDVPIPATATGTGGADLRPFAVHVYQGRVYVGAVNSAESTGLAGHLRGYVFVFDPAANAGAGGFVNTAGAPTSTEAVFEFALNYPRGAAYTGDTRTTPSSANWNPWTNQVQTLSSETYIIYPQPMFTGLAFDQNGHMIIGLRDRTGDQTGFDFAFDNPANPTTLSRGVAAGDMLRAAGNPTAGWTLETITGNGAGNEYYAGDDLPDTVVGPNIHDEVNVGGVLQLAGFPDALSTAYDPVRRGSVVNAGGVRWYSEANGTTQKAYQLYQSGPTTPTFAKANGVGDLIAIQPATREIGNRVWNDANGNGRQDPGEAAIANVQIVLVRDDTPIATATTDANGNYYFSSNFGTSSISKQFGVNMNVAGTYELRIPLAQPALSGLVLTVPPAGPVAQTAPQADNKATLNSTGTQAIIPLTFPSQGAANHNFDVGFYTPVGEVSGVVYVDRDRNGVLSVGDGRIAGVTLVLSGGVGFPPRTVTTDGDGLYSFTGLPFGTYTLEQTQPVLFADGPVNPGDGGSTAGVNTISGIVLDGVNSLRPNNNFGERLGTLSGFVYEDVNRSNSRDVGDVGISGVRVILRGGPGLGVTLTGTTDGSGGYGFSNLEFGTYTVEQVQPLGFVSQSTNPGSPGGGTAGSVGGNDAIELITLTPSDPGLDSPNNNFGEVRAAQTPGRLSGFVYQDANINGRRDDGERPIAGVTLQLFREAAGGALTLVSTTVTDSNGFYQFIDLAPGNYRVVQTQPANFYDGLDQVGTTGGVAENDLIRQIPITAGAESENNNFGEVPHSQILGYVYVDANSNRRFDPGEYGIPNTQLIVSGTAFAGSPLARPLDASLVRGGLTAVTDNSGRYLFASLPPGDYTVTQVPPSGFGTFFQESSARVRIRTVGNSAYDGIELNGPTSGELNFGTNTAPPGFSPASRGSGAAPGQASKQEFLGSSALAATSAASSSSLVRAPSIELNLTPTYNPIGGDPSRPAFLVVGAGAGFAPVVRVFNYATGVEQFRFFAFEDFFTGGVHVATGDVNGDGVPDIIAGAGEGGGPRVRVFDGVTGDVLADFFAYALDFRGGVYVAAGDTDGDGRAEIITGAGPGGGPHVKVFNASGAQLRETFAFGAGVRTGVRVTVGDFSGTGRPDIAVTTGPGGPSDAVLIDGRSLASLGTFRLFESGFTGGAWVAAADVTGDGQAELIAGAGAGGGPHVRVYSRSGQLLSEFFAYESTFSGGARVAARDLNGDGRAEIITGAGISGASRVSIFVAPGFTRSDDFFAFDDGVRTGVFVG